VYLTVEGSRPEHYYQQYPQEAGPIRQRSRVADPHYRTAIDPYVTLTPSERTRIRQTAPGAFVKHSVWVSAVSHSCFHISVLDVDYLCHNIHSPILYCLEWQIWLHGFKIVI